MEAFRFRGTGVGVGGFSILLGPPISNMGAIGTPLVCITTKAVLQPESRCLLMFFSRTLPLQTGLSGCENEDDDRRNIRP